MLFIRFSARQPTAVQFLECRPSSLSKRRSRASTSRVGLSPRWSLADSGLVTGGISPARDRPGLLPQVRLPPHLELPAPCERQQVRAHQAREHEARPPCPVPCYRLLSRPSSSAEGSMPTEQAGALTRVRRIRHEISHEHGNDPHRLVAHYLQLQEAASRRAPKAGGARQPKQRSPARSGKA